MEATLMHVPPAETDRRHPTVGRIVHASNDPCRAVLVTGAGEAGFSGIELSPPFEMGGELTTTLATKQYDYDSLDWHWPELV